MLKAQNRNSNLFISTNQIPLNSPLFIDAVKILQKLIATPSFSGEEARAANHIEEYLRGFARVNRHGNNVWCFNKHFDQSKPTILLNSHLDTVRPNDGYTKNPFKPEIMNGKLFGLGSNDAGGCLVSLMSAFLYFHYRNNLTFNLCFAATAEEENSGSNGIISILPMLGKLEAAIVGEPTLTDIAVDILNDDVFTHQAILDVIKDNIHSEFTVRSGALKSSSIDIEHPIVQAGLACGCKTYGSPTTSDQAWLNIPSIKMGPGDSARSHSSDEFIYVEEIKKGINRYIKLLEMLPLVLINNPNHSKNEIYHINN